MPNSFVTQSDPDACLMERNAVHHAALTDDAVCIAGRFTLAELAALKPGSLAVHRNGCPVGTVEFCQAWMRATDVPEPAPLDYPDTLRSALLREVRGCTYAEARPGYWIKPYRTKAWPAHLKPASQSAQIVTGRDADEPVWEQPYIDAARWLGEWRVYVVNGQIVGSGRYDDKPDEAVKYEPVSVEVWTRLYQHSGQAPAGYALDVARIDRTTVLVEVTDGWAVGYYKGTCSPAHYAALLARRWAQMVNRSPADSLTDEVGSGGPVAAS